MMAAVGMIVTEIEGVVITADVTGLIVMTTEIKLAKNLNQ